MKIVMYNLQLTLAQRATLLEAIQTYDDLLEAIHHPTIDAPSFAPDRHDLLQIQQSLTMLKPDDLDVLVAEHVDSGPLP